MPSTERQQLEAIIRTATPEELADICAVLEHVLDGQRDGKSLEEIKASSQQLVAERLSRRRA